MNLTELNHARTLAVKSVRLNKELSILKRRVDEAFDSELEFDVNLRETTQVKGSCNSKVECKPIEMHDYQEGFFARISAIMQTSNDSISEMKSKTTELKVSGTEAALLFGYLYELKVRELDAVKKELKSLGIEC